MIVEVVSVVNPIHSGSQHNQEVILHNETLEVESFISSIVSDAERKTNAIRETVEVNSFINPIYGDVFVPKKDTTEVISYMSPIMTNLIHGIQSQKIERRTIVSFVNRIDGNIMTITKKKPVIYYANLSYIENPSFSEVIE